MSSDSTVPLASVPATIAMAFHTGFVTTSSTVNPPWSTGQPTSPQAPIRHATMQPKIIEGTIRFRSFAAKGIAPSVIPKQPIMAIDFARSRSDSFHLFLAIIVETKMAIGGTAQIIRNKPLGK